MLPQKPHGESVLVHLYIHSHFQEISTTQKAITPSAIVTNKNMLNRMPLLPQFGAPSNPKWCCMIKV